jgi:hypothetical protein
VDLIAGFFIGIVFAGIAFMWIFLKPMRALEEAVQFIEEDCDAAYRIGVEDGYSCAKEPWNSEYEDVGDYLKENCANKWPELTDDYE